MAAVVGIEVFSWLQLPNGTKEEEAVNREGMRPTSQPREVDAFTFTTSVMTQGLRSEAHGDRSRCSASRSGPLEMPIMTESSIVDACRCEAPRDDPEISV